MYMFTSKIGNKDRALDNKTRENRRDNQEWTNQRHMQKWAQDIE